MFKTGQEESTKGKYPPSPQPQLATGYVEAGAKLLERRGGKTLGEHVGKLGGGRDMENPNIADGDPVAHEVQVDLHVLRPLMLNGVGGEVHGTDVVAVDERSLGKRAVELSQELSEPGRLRHAVRDRPVLRLGTGAGDNWLQLGRSGDEVAAQEDGVAGSGAAGVWTTRPVSVGVDNQLSRSRPVKHQAVVNSATDIPQEALHSSKM